HETNTFAVTPTTSADFQRDSACGENFDGGDTLFKLYRNTGTIHGGYIDAAEQAGVELLPLLCVRAQPAGVVTNESFNMLLGRFLERLDQVMPIDGVVLDLHGAMVTEQYEDAEGAFIAAVRKLVGPDVPIFVTLDFHANITKPMAELADCIVGFDTYPHVDMRERGTEAVELLIQTIRGEVKPVQVYRQLPLITLPPMQCTLREPMQSLMQKVHRMEAEPGVLTATVSMGFPFADIHDAGVSVLVTTDGDAELANQKVDELADQLWELRDDLQPKLTTIEETIRFTNAEADGLVIFADGSDNPGGGAPCDGTVALQALIDADFQGGVVGILYDPETVRQAHAAGVGVTIDAEIGGKTDDRHGSTVHAKAYVKTLSDGKFIHRGPMRNGLPGDFGNMAVLVIGGVEVVVAANRTQLLDAEMLRIVGITPETRRLLVAKSAVHFRADLGPLASHIFDADTPGIHRPDFAAIDYRKLRRPIYPLEEDVTFTR
ncbi:MAG: M81 family metallopeptidase, partial [Planctomycetes bacterium]|nr:M81 family metallopeptidase [Planctomycetota bacterium]